MKFKFFNLFFCVACVLLILLSPAIISSFTYEKPEKIPFKGVLTLWNVSEWRTGYSSCISFLKKRISEFESGNPYLFIEAEDMTSAEAREAFQEGKAPDILSYSLGFNSGVEFAPLPAANTFFPQISGNSHPYMCGCYCILVNTAMLDEKGLLTPEGWGVRPEEFANIAENGVAFDSEQSFSSLPAAVLNQFPEDNGPRISPNVKITLEPIPAHPVYDFSEGLSKFCSGNACALIASHRQLFDAEQMYLDNKAPLFSEYALSSYTDMVQMIGVVKCDDQRKVSACTDFAAYLLRPSVQSKLEALGVLPVIKGLEIYKERECMYAEYMLFCSKPLLARPEERASFTGLARKALEGDKKALNDLRALAGYG